MKRFDLHKCRFWMSDYRFVVYPERHKKMQALVILGMLAVMTPTEVVAVCKCRKNTTDELKDFLEQGKKSEKKVEDVKDVEMKNKDYALVYGAHQRLYGV